MYRNGNGLFHSRNDVNREIGVLTENNISIINIIGIIGIICVKPGVTSPHC
ncbi:hypothetical protein CLOAM1036 [Candidatus Cloacimonas acidaminovorans str. Evry]|uniref:Uncharacterized protein n=1 Tax=Cloacimonas acidaminovorans (strain Evry) TaxID=459349 RepID=B0VHU3_CLOAI|nr:hypothetical protein CLOAM1036 [Candidatus Cloacimonas acidaminovorans str. Evry]